MVICISLSIANSILRTGNIQTSSRMLRKCSNGMKSLLGKHVVITGGSSGIGLACAIESVKEGAIVTIIARNIQKLENAKSRIKEEVCKKLQDENSGMWQESDNLRTVAADVTDSKSISSALKEIYSLQPIDVLILNAGIVRPGYVEDLPIAAVEETVRTNLLGAIFPIQTLLPLMKARSQGQPCSIVFMCSLSGLTFWYGAAVYTATKYAVRGLAESLRVELLPYNINVGLVCPGFTDTPFLDDAESSEAELIQMMKVASLYDRRKVESPENIAKCTIRAIKRGDFLTTTTTLGGFFRILSRGFFPADSWLGRILEAMVASPLRFLTIIMAFGMKMDIKNAFEKIRMKKE